MDRRHFLRTASVASAGFALAETSYLFGRIPGAYAFSSEAAADGWRTFEVTTRVEIVKPVGVTRIWVPAALETAAPFQKAFGTTYNADGGKINLTRNGSEGLGIVSAEFAEGARPMVTVTSKVATRNIAVNLDSREVQDKASPAELQEFLQPGKYIPTDGIVKTTAAEITKGASTDVEKARAIYEWIVDNTHRNPKTRGCGIGDIRFMLESKDLGGKCADLNALFVGLSRAAGIPARDVYGIRVAKSELGYKSLGASSEKITKSQHCRAEVYLQQHGWTPVDPADVRKVVLEEPPGNLPVTDDMVKRARTRLFGSWEMNWMAYNFAKDVTLPGSNGKPLAFFMYPQAETSEGRLDCLDADNFKYEITTKELITNT